MNQEYQQRIEEERKKFIANSKSLYVKIHRQVLKQKEVKLARMSLMSRFIRIFTGD